MAVAKRFEVYQDPDVLRQPLGTTAYGPRYMQSSHMVKIYSLKRIRPKSYNLQTVGPFSNQLWSRDLGLLALASSCSSSLVTVSFRDQLGLSYQLNPYVTPYSLDDTDSFTFQSHFSRAFLLPRTVLEMQAAATWYTAYEFRSI